MENLNWDEHHKYIFILVQRIQTRCEQVINRIEIGEVMYETNMFLAIKTHTGKKIIKKALISKAINITNISNIETQFLVDRLESRLV